MGGDLADLAADAALEPAEEDHAMTSPGRGLRGVDYGSTWLDSLEVGEPSQCWRWLGSHRRDGRPYRVIYRQIYALVHGEPQNHIHHACENAACVNPSHLVDLPEREHRKLHRKCDHGEEHRVWYANGSRCRICHAAKMREYRRKR